MFGYIAGKKINEEISIDNETVEIETSNNKYVFAVLNGEPICNIYEKEENKNEY